ncbi:MAG: arsenate reductase ArsC [Thermoplasmata archaeon]|nr:arsenate reductase ArsC [Thermoplasmata archaeon]
MKKILFLCVGNSCRSQMAEAFANHHGKGIVEAQSAGTMPAGLVAPKAVEVMKEKGIDMSGQYPKPLNPALIKDLDYLISMGCGVSESCINPQIQELVENFDDWAIEDPIHQPIETYRKVRDKIEAKVLTLLEEIGK